MKHRLTYALALLFATLQTFAQTYTYDSDNRLTKVVYGNGVTVSYEYDALGNRTSKKVTGGENASIDSQKQELVSALQALADELRNIGTELSNKATEEQATELYGEFRRMQDACAAVAFKIESIVSQDDVVKCQADLQDITNKAEALRGKVDEYQVPSTAEVDGISYEITDNVKKEVEVIAGRGEGLYFEISIPGSVKIGNELYNVVGLRERALENTGVKSVTIAEGIKRIGYFCFLNTALRELVLPSSIESIETLAFANDPLDKIVSYITNPMAINDNTFDHSYERATLYVPAGSKEKYEATDGWKLFKKIVEMGGEVPPGNIAFADAPVKVVCLENWDTNGDGYLSFEEAAAVKDLGQAFRLNWQITSFDELQYFTGLTNIAEQAFSNCDHLTSVVIPNSVTTIGYAAFNGCTSLTSVTIPESVDTIGGSAFQNCRSLTSVTIPNSVTSIGQTAFSGCKSLTSINIPESMTIIESAVFSACSNLTTITIPNSITRIKDHAFAKCTGLTEIRSYIEKPFFSHQGSWYNVDKSIPLYVPAGTKVKYQTTEYWYEFTNIIEMGGETPNLDPTLIQFADTEVKRICVENWDTNGDGELSYDEAAAVTSIGTVFRNNKVMTTFDELEYFTGLTEIGDNAFSWSSIESVKIPNNVTHIGEQAFRGSGMSSPIIPKSVTSIGKEAFSYNWLNSIVVEAGNTVYDSRDNCNAIIHTATNELVQGCANTTIPNSVTSIGDAAFLGCDGLKSISIPSSVTTIGNFAFKECHYLTDVSIPNSVTTIGIEAFEITGLSSVVIPNSVTYIGNNAFWGCSMTSLTIPNSITTIESETFMYCKSLTSVIIPNSITSIGWNAFADCSALASVTSFIEIPRAINDGVFEYLPEDATLYVPAGSKARYESTDGWKNFKNIVEMEAVTPDPNIKFADPKVKAICVANWDINGDHELSYEEAAAVTDLGRVFYSNHDILSFDELQYFTGLKVIGERAFSMCQELISITLPNSLDSIGRYAFFDCYYLTNINFGNSVKYIGDHAIGYCDNLPSVTIPNSVTTIDEWAFNGCLNLSSITIPNSVTSIGQTAFFRCPKLTEVYSYIKEPFSVYWPLGEESIPTLYVPAGTKAKYQATDGWKEFKYIVEMAPEKGDIGGKGYTDVTDVVAAINHILGEQPLEETDAAVVDMNSDGEVNVADIILLVKQILEQGNHSETAQAARGDRKTVDLTRFTAMQLSVDVPTGSRLSGIRLAGRNNDTHQLMYQQAADGSYTVVVWSIDNQTFSPVDGRLIEVTVEGGGEAAARCVLLADKNGERLTLGSLPVGTATEITTVCTDGAATADIYDLRGNKVLTKGALMERLPKGVYIMDGKAIIK